MAVLRESPWYQEIDQQGEQRGLLRGREEGRQEGRQEGAAQEASSLVFRQLSRHPLSLTASASSNAFPLLRN
jgi:predicted transposase YdaD